MWIYPGSEYARVLIYQGSEYAGVTEYAWIFSRHAFYIV